MVVGLGAMAWRRLRFHKPELDYRRVDIAPATSDRTGFAVGDWIFLGWLLAPGRDRVRGRGRPDRRQRLPLVRGLLAGRDGRSARIFGALGLSAAAAADLHLGLWWFHAIVALGFVAYIPYAKAIHILADGVNVALRSPLAGKRLPVLPAATPPPPALDPPGGAGRDRRSRRAARPRRLQLEAAPRSRRLHEVRALSRRLSGGRVGRAALAAGPHPRPAPAGGRGVGRARARLGAAIGPGVRGDRRQRSSADGRDVVQLDGAMTVGDSTFGPRPVTSGGLVAGGLIRAETLWSCTTCLACVEACPVGIEHVPTIVGMRRSLVDQGIVEPGLQTAFTSLAKQGNSFGQSGRARAKWTDGLATPIRDARQEEVDWLWFVGDFASFDVRVQDATRLVARVLQAAGVDFGILYEGERNAGNDVRRAGEEGLFEMLVEHNVGQLADGPLPADRDDRPAHPEHAPPRVPAVRRRVRGLALLAAPQRAVPRRPPRDPPADRSLGHLPRPVLPGSLQRRHGGAARGAGGDRRLARRDASQRGEHVLLRGRRRPHLDGRLRPPRASVRAAHPRGRRPAARRPTS